MGLWEVPGLSSSKEKKGKKEIKDLTIKINERYGLILRVEIW